MILIDEASADRPVRPAKKKAPFSMDIGHVEFMQVFSQTLVNGTEKTKQDKKKAKKVRREA